jgi:uncharacterized protein (TIGR03437 family)
VNPPVEAGQPAPESTVSRTVNPVKVTIGGRQAQVLFSGLTPRFAGLYQVNAVVPEGIVAGEAVPVVITALEQESLPVTVAVQ